MDTSDSTRLPLIKVNTLAAIRGDLGTIALGPSNVDRYPKSCACFPGQCRGGEVIFGRTVTGQICRDEVDKLIKSPAVIEAAFASDAEAEREPSAQSADEFGGDAGAAAQRVPFSDLAGRPCAAGRGLVSGADAEQLSPAGLDAAHDGPASAAAGACGAGAAAPGHGVPGGQGGSDRVLASAEVAAPTRADGVNYERLVAEAWALHKYRCGTPTCVAFKRGAEWQDQEARKAQTERLAKLRVDPMSHAALLLQIADDHELELTDEARWVIEEAAEEIQRLLVQAPKAQGDDWRHLKQYGYAPGDYMIWCDSCQKTVSGVDKRAVTCRPCAEARQAQKSALAEQPWQAMVYAPRDGSKIELLVEHHEYWVALKNNRADDYRQECIGHWVDFNGGGWSWQGTAGRPIGWRPLRGSATGGA